MRLLWWIAAILAVPPGPLLSQAAQPMPAAQLVREVVYNELHDHGVHGYWRYWIERSSPKGMCHEDQVETAEGPVTRLSLLDGRPPSPEVQQLEQARLTRLLTSPQEQARHRQEYADDEKTHRPHRYPVAPMPFSTSMPATRTAPTAFTSAPTPPIPPIPSKHAFSTP